MYSVSLFKAVIYFIINNLPLLFISLYILHIWEWVWSEYLWQKLFKDFSK